MSRTEGLIFGLGPFFAWPPDDGRMIVSIIDHIARDTLMPVVVLSLGTMIVTCALIQLARHNRFLVGVILLVCALFAGTAMVSAVDTLGGTDRSVDPRAKRSVKPAVRPVTLPLKPNENSSFWDILDENAKDNRGWTPLHRAIDARGKPAVLPNEHHSFWDELHQERIKLV